MNDGDGDEDGSEVLVHRRRTEDSPILLSSSGPFGGLWWRGGWHFPAGGPLLHLASSAVAAFAGRVFLYFRHFREC